MAATADDADEEIVVQIDDALLGEVAPQAPAADVVAKVDAGKPDAGQRAGTDDPLTSLKTQFSTLQSEAAETKRQRDQAMQREADANRRAEAASREAASAKTQAVESQYDTVVSGLDAAKSEADAAEREYRTAFESGDAAGAAAAQRKIARSEARITRLEEAKADYEDVARRSKAQPQQPQHPTPQGNAGDPVEAYLNGRTEPTKAWLRQHTEWITDHRKNSKLTAGHYAAVGDGLTPDTPEYFASVEKFIGLRAEPAQPQQRRASAPTVPVTHAGGGTNGGGTEVKLSRAEAEASRDGTLVWNYNDPKGRFKKGDPIGTQEFARRKLAMQRDGRYDRVYVES